MVRRPSVVHPSVVSRSQSSNTFFSETAGPIKAKFYVEPPRVEGTKVCSRDSGYMTKMTATPIYRRNPSKIFFPEPVGLFPRNLVCSIGDSSPIIVCSNDDSGLILTYFTARSNFVIWAFPW